jgi:dihydrofolate reductase
MDCETSSLPVRCSLIVAMSENGVIGREGDIPWRLSSDLRRFKRLTMGHALVMGRKTFESIGPPLPGRRSVVITRQLDYRPANVEVVSSWEEARLLVAESGEFFVIGGGEIYRLALPDADRIYLTVVSGEVEGDVTFPDIDGEQWQPVERSEHPADDRNERAHTFQILDRQARGELRPRSRY